MVELAAHRGLQVIGAAAPADEKLVSCRGAQLFVSRGPPTAQRILDLVPRASPRWLTLP
jgi:hypothetical protein